MRQRSGSDADAGRDLALAPQRTAAGYVTVPDGLDPGDTEWLTRQWGEALAAFAAGEGYRLGAVFTEVRGRGESGLYALIGHVRRTGAAAVVVPDLRHLIRAGCLAGADPLTAGRFLHAPVLAVEGPSFPAVAGPAGSRRNNRRAEREWRAS